MPSAARPALILAQAGGAALPAAAVPDGITPAVLRHAYGVDRVAFGAVAGDGSGQTIAVVDAYDQPGLADDLAAFDRQFDLPDPPRLTKINEAGGADLPRADRPGGWGVETSLDVEWAHALAPGAAILLIEADSARLSDLFAAVDTARNYPGVGVVSLSWGADETTADLAADAHFTTPAGHNGVTFIASSGDRGAYGASGAATVLYPAASPNVVAVGGTDLTTGPGGTYVSESAWGHGADSSRAGGSGGGVSRLFRQPGYQQGVVTQDTAFRAVPDVAFDADPAGVPVYDGYDGATPWLRVGGTSLVAPLWAGVIALADQGRGLEGRGTLDGRRDTLPDLYALPAGDFHDVTTGGNGYAADAGYDLATGRGSPAVNRLVADLAGAADHATTRALTTAPVPSVGTVADVVAVPLGFTNWAAIQPAIAQVPMTAGQLANVSVVNFGTTVYTGPLNVANTINRIRANNGPITRDDGIVFTNSGHPLPPGGTYYEFNVAPSNGTDHRFTFASPGPMRLVLNTGGSLYFTGDHYATFTPVYVHGQSVPTIGSFTVNPATVTAGAAATLTAANVTEAGGTISTVTFYLESNGVPGLQIGSDTLVGTGSRNGTTWTLAVSTAGFAAGTYTYYAVATDTAGTSSTVASATLTVTRGTPRIASFTVNPNTVQAGMPVTLTAGNVTEAGGTVTGVGFYLESNGVPGLQTDSDTYLGGGSQSGSDWSLALATDGYTAGTYTLYAVATDDIGVSSAVASATLTVTGGTGIPTIGSFTVNPGTVPPGTPVALTAGSVTDTGGTVVGVAFYLESNGVPGLQTDSDTYLGGGSQSGSDWSLALATDGYAAGIYTLYTVATDDAGNTSAVASTTLTVTGGTGMPTIGSFTVRPGSVPTGTPVTLTAGNVTDTGGTIVDVSFYLESNGIPGLQTDSDTPLGSGSQNGNDWSLAASTSGFAAGTYTFYAVATDDSGVSSAVASVTLTVTDVGFSGVLLGWDVNGLRNFGPQGYAATQTAAGVSNSVGLTRGSGVATSQTAATNAWGGSNWAATSAAGISGNEFVTFALTVAVGDRASLSAMDLYYRRSSSGPANGYWQYQLNGGAWVVIGDFPNAFASTSSSGAAMNELDLRGIAGLQNLAGGTVVVFRLVPYAAANSGGTWYVYDQAGNDLVVNGTVQGGGNTAIPPRHHAGVADLAAALPSVSRPPSFGVIGPDVRVATDPRGAAPALPWVAEQPPVISVRWPAIHRAGVTGAGDVGRGADDILGALTWGADAAGTADREMIPC